MEALSKILAGIVMVVIGTIVNGFFFMKIWTWFMVPVFENLPVLTFPQSVGVATFIMIIRQKRTDTKGKDFLDVVSEWFEGLFYTVVLFGLSYVVYFFIQY